MAKQQTKSKKAGRSRKAPKVDAAVPATWPESKPRKARVRDPRLPAAGATLTRTFKGKDYRVTVLDAGFRYDGREFHSLTAIAREVTGYPAISGPAWFGITEQSAAPAKPPAAPAKTRTARTKRAKRDPQPTPAPATATDAEVARAE